MLSRYICASPLAQWSWGYIVFTLYICMSIRLSVYGMVSTVQLHSYHRQARYTYFHYPKFCYGFAIKMSIFQCVVIVSSLQLWRHFKPRFLARQVLHAGTKTFTAVCDYESKTHYLNISSETWLSPNGRFRKGDKSRSEKNIVLVHWRIHTSQFSIEWHGWVIASHNVMGHW